MAYVLDASVAGSWCFHDEHDVRADAAFALLDADTALVPAIWWFEVRNVVLRGVRRKRFTGEHMTGFLRRLEKLPILVAPLPRSDDVFSVASQHHLTFYDAAYLELARRQDVALATLDAALARAAASEGIPLIGES